MAGYRVHTRLSDLARAQIESLQAEGCDLTPDEIIKINALGHAIENPRSRLDLARGNPVTVGRVTLWPLSPYASYWYQRIGENLGSARMGLRALAYAMAHPEKDLPEGRVRAFAVVLSWARTLRCRNAQLTEAVAQVIAQDEEVRVPDPAADRDEDAPTYGELSCILSAMTGTAPVVWERQCSMRYVRAMLEKVMAQNAADGKSMKKDARLKYHRVMAMLVYRIQERHKNGQA